MDIKTASGKFIGIVRGKSMYSKRTVATSLWRMGRKTVEEARKAGTTAWRLNKEAIDGLKGTEVKRIVINSDENIAYILFLDEFFNKDMINDFQGETEYVVMEQDWRMERITNDA